MKLSKKTLPYIALAVIVVGAGAYFLWGRTSSTPVITSDVTPQSASEATFLGLATELDTVSFDASLFTDSRFTTLKDVHTAVIAEPIGRRDPFGGLSGITPAQ